MGGLQALDVVVGCAFFLGLVSVIASGAAESLSRLLRKRSKDLEHAVARLLGEEEPTTDSVCGRLKAAIHRMSYVAPNGRPKLAAFKATEPFKMVESARAPTLLPKKPMPEYIDPSTFAAAIVEMPAEHRPSALSSAERARLTFEASMRQLTESYKRWATVVLFLVSLLVCAMGNLSVISLAQALWSDDVTRAALVEEIKNGNTRTVAAQFSDQPPTCQVHAEDVRQNASTPQSQNPILRTDHRLGWHCKPWKQLGGDGFGSGMATVFGWLLTATLSLLGAKFWFDTAGRVVGLRPDGRTSRRPQETTP